MALKIPKDRYICKNQWNKEFELAPYSDTSDQLQADHTSWDKMLKFSRKLATNYGLPKENWYRFLWTSFDGDNGTMYLKNGTVFVNHLVFWFSKKPWGINNNKQINDLTIIEIAWEDQEDCHKKNT